MGLQHVCDFCGLQVLTYHHGLLTLGIDVTTFPHLPYLHRSPRGSPPAKSSHRDHPFKDTFPPFRVGAFHRPQGKEQVKAALSKPKSAAGGYDLVVVALGVLLRSLLPQEAMQVVHVEKKAAAAVKG